MRSLLLLLTLVPLTPAQTISTLAGKGSSGFSGDGGAATEAQLAEPRHVAVDKAGNVYIADTMNLRVRKVTTAGVIATFAGTGDYPTFLSDNGEGGPATRARLPEVMAAAADASGNLYVLDAKGVRKITPEGILSTIGGGGGDPMSDNIRATDAMLVAGIGLCAGSDGSVYIAIHDTIRKIAPSGIITTVAGNALRAGFGGDGGPATAASFRDVNDVALDSEGNLYIADGYNNRVRKVDTAGVVTTVAGNGNGGNTGDGGRATAAAIGKPQGLVVDPAGNLYIAIQDRIRKVDRAGVISTIAGGGRTLGDGGPATQARFQALRGLALDDTGSNLYAADELDHRIRKIALKVAGPPSIAARGVLNGASFTEMLSPGAMFSLFGSDLAPSTESAASAPLPDTIAGVSVRINGVKAPLFFVSPNQINGQVPYSIAPLPSSFAVSVGDRTSAAVTVFVQETAPGILLYNGDSAVAQNEDYSLNSESAPARPGAALIVYMTGQGALDNPVASGAAAPSEPLSRPRETVSATIGGQTADVLFAGLTPGFVGLLQVNLRVPGVPAGAAQLQVTIGQGKSNFAKVWVAR